jgi:hypothetical protein
MRDNFCLLEQLESRLTVGSVGNQELNKNLIASLENEYVNSTISLSTNVSNQSENNTKTAALMETGKTALYSFCLRSNNLSK